MAKKKEMNERLTFNLEGVLLENYMQSQYKDIQFELAYLSRIIKYLEPVVERLKIQREFYNDIIKNSLHPKLMFCSDSDFEYDNYPDFGDFSDDVTNLSDEALNSITKIKDGWRKQNLNEDYYNEKRPKVTSVTKNS